MFEFSRVNSYFEIASSDAREKKKSYFERILMVRMVRMVRSLADRTFQLCPAPPGSEEEGLQALNRRRHGGPRAGPALAPRLPCSLSQNVDNMLSLW